MKNTSFWLIALMSVSGTLCCGSVVSVAFAESTRPNFILINIDDLGYADIEPFGCDHQKTPNLVKMAATGRKLHCFYAAPVCSPSRASLMTGCYPKRVLPIGHVLFPADKNGLASNELTVAELLKQQGYATGIVGKWHLGDQPQWLPTKQGFDTYYGLPYSNDMGPVADGVKSNFGAAIPQKKAANDKSKGQPPLPLMRDDKVVKRVLAEDQQQLVKNYTHEAIEFIRRHKSEPFFLYLPHSAVHFPLYPSEEFRGTSNNGLYGDWVQEVDWSVGEVLNTLSELQLTNKTLVMFTSDNGGPKQHGADNGPLRGFKGSTYEGGMRVPTIVSWPGTIPPGTATDAVLSNMDVLPTFVKLAGGSVPTDRKIDGVDMLPWLVGEEKLSTAPRETFLFYRGLELQAVRMGDFKYHLQSGELFQLSSDIGETTDVASKHPDVIERIQQICDDVDTDLGVKDVGPGCRELGTISDPVPLIAHD
jgi:arylsulfatase A